MNVWKLKTTRMSVRQLSNGKRMDGIYTPTLAPNTESVATFITTCYLKKANKTCMHPMCEKNSVRQICKELLLNK